MCPGQHNLQLPLCQGGPNLHLRATSNKGQIFESHDMKHLNPYIFSQECCASVLTQRTLSLHPVNASKAWPFLIYLSLYIHCHATCFLEPDAAEDPREARKTPVRLGHRGREAGREDTKGTGRGEQRGTLALPKALQEGKPCLVWLLLPLLYGDSTGGREPRLHTGRKQSFVS